MDSKYFLPMFFVSVILWTGVAIKSYAAEADYFILPALSAQSIPADIHEDSRARLPMVSRDNLNVTGQNAFDTYVTSGTGYETGLRGPIGMLMNSPVLAEAMFDVRNRVRYGSAKNQRLTELTIITTAREVDNQYIYTAHEPAARRNGLEQEIIDIVRFRERLDDSIEISGLGEEESIIIQITREAINEEKVSSETFAKAVEVFGNEGVMDLVGLIGYYNFMAITIRSFDIHRHNGSDLLLPIKR
jgi:4-carboxymuconolactone decarboxylase